MTTPAASARRPVNVLLAYRDDGPLARALPPLAPVPASALTLVAALSLLVAIVLTGEDAGDATVALVIGWVVLTGGLAARRPHTDRLRWIVPPLLRFCEYAGLLWIGVNADATAAAFTLMAVLAFRHYDTVYRLRFQGVTAPAWVANLAAGWEGRLLIGVVLLAVGALPAGFYVIAAVLAVVFATECVDGWRRFGTNRQPDVYEDEEEIAE